MSDMCAHVHVYVDMHVCDGHVYNMHVHGGISRVLYSYV